MTYLTPKDVVALLCAHRGGKTLKQFAEEVGCSFQFMAAVLRGKRNPGDAMLDYLKLDKVVVYQKK
jgi:hypothetical protein